METTPKPDPSAVSPFAKVVADLGKITDARLQVIVTHAFIELLVNTLVDVKAVNAKRIADGGRDFTQSVKLTLLHEMGVLSDHHNEMLHWFRKLRNRAAHDWDFDINVNDLQNFAEEFHREPSNFYRTCQLILTELAAVYLADATAIFLSDGVGEEEPGVLMVKEPAVKWLVGLKSDPDRKSRPASSPDRDEHFKMAMKAAREGLSGYGKSVRN